MQKIEISKPKGVFCFLSVISLGLLELKNDYKKVKSQLNSSKIAPAHSEGRVIFYIG